MTRHHKNRSIQPSPKMILGLKVMALMEIIDGEIKADDKNLSKLELEMIENFSGKTPIEQQDALEKLETQFGLMP